MEKYWAKTEQTSVKIAKGTTISFYKIIHLKNYGINSETFAVSWFFP